MRTRIAPCVLSIANALAALSVGTAAAQEVPWKFQDGVRADEWARIDLAAVVRVEGRHKPLRNENDSRREWPVTVLSSCEGASRPTTLRVNGSWGQPHGRLEEGGTYIVLGMLPRDGREGRLYPKDQDWERMPELPEGFAAAFWAIPYSGAHPPLGGPKETWFGRAVLAAIESDPSVVTNGLSRFISGTEAAVFGLVEAAPTDPSVWWEAGVRPNEFTEGLVEWGHHHGLVEQLFAAAVQRRFGVWGSASMWIRAVYDWAELDADPRSYGFGGSLSYIRSLSNESVPLESRGDLFHALPTSEQWLTRLLSLKNPRAQELLLFTQHRDDLDHDQRRRLSALLDSPLTNVRFGLCRYFWQMQDEPNAADEPKEHSEGRTSDNDYPRLDEHVAYWKAFFKG